MTALSALYFVAFVAVMASVGWGTYRIITPFSRMDGRDWTAVFLAVVCAAAIVLAVIADSATPAEEAWRRRTQANIEACRTLGGEQVLAVGSYGFYLKECRLRPGGRAEAER